MANNDELRELIEKYRMATEKYAAATEKAMRKVTKKRRHAVHPVALQKAHTEVLTYAEPLGRFAQGVLPIGELGGTTPSLKRAAGTRLHHVRHLLESNRESTFPSEKIDVLASFKPLHISIKALAAESYVDAAGTLVYLPENFAFEPPQWWQRAATRYSAAKMVSAIVREELRALAEVNSAAFGSALELTIAPETKLSNVTSLAFRPMFAMKLPRFTPVDLAKTMPSGLGEEFSAVIRNAIHAETYVSGLGDYALQLAAAAPGQPNGLLAEAAALRKGELAEVPAPGTDKPQLASRGRARQLRIARAGDVFIDSMNDAISDSTLRDLGTARVLAGTIVEGVVPEVWDARDFVDRLAKNPTFMERIAR